MTLEKSFDLIPRFSHTDTDKVTVEYLGSYEQNLGSTALSFLPPKEAADEIESAPQKNNRRTRAKRLRERQLSGEIPIIREPILLISRRR